MSRTTAEDTAEIGFRLSAETRPGRLCPSTEYKVDNRHIRNAKPVPIDAKLSALLALEENRKAAEIANQIEPDPCMSYAVLERLRELRLYGESLCKAVPECES